MATYRTAPNLGKPPAPFTLTKRARRASAEGAAAMRAASAGRLFGSKTDLKRQAREEARRTTLHTGPHPLPVERIRVGRLEVKGEKRSLLDTDLTGGAKTLAIWLALEAPHLVVLAARNAREVEVRIGRQAHADGGGNPGEVARVVFRDGRLVHAMVHDGAQHVKRTLTALKTDLLGLEP